MTKFGRADSFAVAVLFPAFGRLFWAAAVSFMLLATTSQLGNGKHTRCVVGSCRVTLNYECALFFGNFPDCVTLFTSFWYFSFSGNVSRFWKAKVFVPLSRLSFSSYILNPLIIMTIVHSCQNSLHLNFYTIPIESVGYYCIINILAVVFTVVFLMPVSHLISLVLWEKNVFRNCFQKW